MFKKLYILVGTCNTALGLSSGAVADSAISSSLGEDTTPASGRLNDDKGAWCFGWDSIVSQNAIFIVDLGRKIFVSGFASQGPPASVYPKTYNHVVGFQAEFSLDKKTWDVFNGENLVRRQEKKSSGFKNSVSKYVYTYSQPYDSFIRIP